VYIGLHDLGLANDVATAGGVQQCEQQSSERVTASRDYQQIMP